MTTFSFGETTVTRIEESLKPSFEASMFLPDFSQAAIEPHAGWFVPDHYAPDTGQLVLSMHSWLIRTPQYTVLLDTCIGDDKDMPQLPAFHMQKSPYLANLEAAGVSPEEIDFVLCTHLHMDHVGWNTRLEDGRWVPTFPNARYVFSETEHDHWATGQDGGGPSGVFKSSVLPVVEAGMTELVAGDHALGDQLLITPAPGHTPGHIAVQLEDSGERGLFSGDSLHSPIQGPYPDWNSAFCEDPETARSTRRRLLGHCCETGALLMPQHFGQPFATKVRQAADAFAFDFMP